MKIAKMPDGSAEIFFTLQGEGRNVGRPSVFIRSSLCNLHCQWCDTDYTWNWQGTEYQHESGRKYVPKEQVLTLDEAEIVEIANQYCCSNFVFTGGEPLLQQSGWVALMGLFNSDNCHFEIETNGTLMPGPEFVDKIDQINVSPKLANSGVAESQRYQPDVLKQLAELEKADFKFVVGDHADFDEVQSMVKEAGIVAEHVFLMPQARTLEQLESNQKWVADMAQQAGYRYSDRLHLRLYGAKRGV